MPEISLRAYESEIDELIEQARYLEALAHIRHLLSQHPHYIHAYYLLGKTMLEADMPELAIDLFRRALSADPENLMARIGLGLAHERRNDLDAAIWNLERALEFDPGNADIADELRRMYGRRDGEEPEYIPQTQGGLARLYLRGNRFKRAVEEFRQIRGETEVVRPDIMTALTEAYWRDEQLVQAADMCQEILDKMPYNCKANLLLGTLWLNSGQEEGELYLSRAQKLDLENRLAQELFGSASLLEPRDITVERLVYDPDTLEVDRESAWFRRLEAASISVGISEAPPEMTESEVRLVDITAGLESQIEIPDWLRELEEPEEGVEEGELSWMAEVGIEEAEEVSHIATEESPTDVEIQEPSQEEPAYRETVEVQAEIEETEAETEDWLDELSLEAEDDADWLQELVREAEPATPEDETSMEVPEGFKVPPAEEPAEAPAESETEDLPEWLQDLAPEDIASGEGVPDWLSDLQATVAQDTTEVDFTAEDLEELPDWLTDQLHGAEEAVEGNLEEEIAEAEEVPDWLSDLKPTVTEEAEDVALSEEAVPSWLSELQPTEPEEIVEPEVEAPPDESLDLEEPSAPEAVAEEVPDWLADFAPEEAGTAEVGPAESAEGASDWLTELRSTEGDVESTEAQKDAMEEPAEEAVDVDSLMGEGEATLSGDEALAWLESLTIGKEEELREQAEAEQADRIAEILGRKREVVSEPEPEAEEAPIEDELLAGDETLAWLEELAAEEETVAEEAEPAAETPAADEEVMSGDDALAWLESLAAGKEEELRDQAEAEQADRVAEILGRKPEMAPEAKVEGEASEVAEEPVTEPSEPEPSEPKVEEADLMSGDEALAWLESLTVGKEEELRRQTEAEQADRVAEILGRKRKASAEPEAPEAAEEASEAPGDTTWEDKTNVVGVEGEEAAPPATQTPEVEQKSEFFGWSSFGDAPHEITEMSAMALDLAENESVEPEAADDTEEDARAWLKGLSDEEESELQAELDSESVMAQAPETELEEERAFFGWATFGDTAKEVTDGTVEDIETTSAAADATLSGVETIEPAIEAEPSVEDVTPDVEVDVAPEPLIEPPEAEPEVEAEVELETPEEGGIEESSPVTEEAASPSEVSVEVPPTSEAETVEAEVEDETAAPSEEITPEALDELRAQVKKKRSDYDARLSLGRALWASGEIQEAMQHYGRLIKSGAKSDEVQEDLLQYKTERPAEPAILRALGDLYMKDGDLEQALALYNRAMDLL